MKENNDGFALKIAVLLSFLLMMTVNALANILPLNGQTTGEVANAYPNLFTPAPLTFTIWGVIYLLLACYVIYQLGFFQKKRRPEASLLKSIAIYFIISSLANAAWIFSWHFEIIFLSVLLMAVILVCLILVTRRLNRRELSAKEKFFLKLPFSIYFGWITVATIANITVFLVSIGWNGFSLGDEFWMLIILTVGLLLGSIVILKNKDVAYGLVLIWAYLGILIRHISVAGYEGAYPKIIVMILVCLALFAATEAYAIMSVRKTIR